MSSYTDAEIADRLKALREENARSAQAIAGLKAENERLKLLLWELHDHEGEWSMDLENRVMVCLLATAEGANDD